MPLALVETGHCNVTLKSSPIEPSWILEGNPEARSNVLSTSACKTTTTLICCTEGYDVDETTMILEGSIVLESEGMPPRRYGVADVILFGEGAQVEWHVEKYVKKIAFFRQTLPFGLLRRSRHQQAEADIFPRRRASLRTTTRQCPALWLNRRGYSRIRSGPLFVSTQSTRPYPRALA
jgi:uncharacterized protein